MNRFTKSLVFSTMLAISATQAYAHRVNIFAYTEGDTVKTESSFSGGSLVRNGVVSVIDPSTHTVLLEGNTNDKGLYDFSLKSLKYIPEAGLTIQINAGEGHQNTWSLERAELGDHLAQGASALPESTSEKHLPQADTTSSETLIVTSAELEAILDRKLAPIKRDLALATDKTPTITDIVGGIGWLFGLFGVWAMARRRDDH